MSFQNEVHSSLRTQAEIDADRPIAITTVLANPTVAKQLAQFCKRSTFSLFYDLTEAHLSHDERTEKAYQMIAGVEAVQRSLAQAGFDHR